MLTKERCYEIAEQVKRISSADEIEVYISGGRSALTRFANNTIHQNVADENHAVSVRTVFSGRTARATSNKLDEDSLRRVVQTAENLSKVQHPNPDLLPMTDGKEPLRAVPSRWFEETRAIGPQQRAEGVGKIVDVAKREKLVTAGIFAVSEYMEALFNSRGMARHHQQTSSEISITMLADDSSGWQRTSLRAIHARIDSPLEVAVHDERPSRGESAAEENPEGHPQGRNRMPGNDRRAYPNEKKEWNYPRLHQMKIV